MCKLFSMLFFFSLVTVCGQNVKNIQQEINETIWKPFQKAFETNDAIALNNLYGEEVLRVTPTGVDTENNFKTGNIERFKTNAKQNTKVRLDFWFDSRRTNEDTSYEVGFYRIRLTNKDKENSIYGQFHIVLKKTKGTWKITQDWDTTSIGGKTIDKADFDLGTKLFGR